MQFFICYFIALVALGAADPKPQTAISSSLEPVQKFGKKLTTPELTLYLTSDILKALQDVKLSKKSASSIENLEKKTQTNQENYNLGHQNNYAQQSQPSVTEKPQKKNRGFVSRFFLPRDKDVIENQEKNDLAKFYLESLKVQNSIYNQLQNLQQKNANKKETQTQTNTKSVPYIPVSYKNQEEILLHDQLLQQWKRILDHNGAQLQGFSASRDQNEKESSAQIIKKYIEQQESKIEAQQGTRTEKQTSKTEDQKSDVEKEIENIIRNHQAFNFATSNSPDNNPSPPILIHKEVRITKHHPVPVYKRVKVPVPRPVLVPVPEPYVVKSPHPYPVPVNIIKHIPVPVIRN